MQQVEVVLPSTRFARVHGVLWPRGLRPSGEDGTDLGWGTKEWRSNLMGRSRSVPAVGTAAPTRATHGSDFDSLLDGPGDAVTRGGRQQIDDAAPETEASGRKYLVVWADLSVSSASESETVSSAGATDRARPRRSATL